MNTSCGVETCADQTIKLALCVLYNISGKIYELLLLNMCKQYPKLFSCRLSSISGAVYEVWRCGKDSCSLGLQFAYYYKFCYLCFSSANLLPYYMSWFCFSHHSVHRSYIILHKLFFLHSFSHNFTQGHT